MSLKRESTLNKENQVASVKDSLPDLSSAESGQLLGPEQRIQRLVAGRSEYEGPLPPPALFREFGQVVPTAPERILKQFELDSEHFRKISSKALDGEINSSSRAQWMAFVLVIACVVAAFALARYGHETIAGILLASTLVPIVLKYLGQNEEAPKETEKTAPRARKSKPKR